MAVNGQAYPIQLLDSNGAPVGRAILIQYTDADDQPGSGGGGGLPTGWTINDPDVGDMNTNGGGLLVPDGGTIVVAVTPNLVQVFDSNSDARAAMTTSGVESGPGAGETCFTAIAGNGATAALQGAGLAVVGVGSASLASNGPTDIVSFYGVTGSAQPQVPATPLPQDIVDALVAVGLVSQAT